MANAVRTDQAVADYLRYLRALGRSEKTLDSYAWALDKLQAASAVLPTTINPIIEILAPSNLALESRYDLWRVLRTFFSWAAVRYEVPNPMTSIGAPSRDQLIPRTLELDEVHRLIELTDNPRDFAMIMLVLDTGMRLDEVAGLRWPHIQGTRIFIPQGKGGRQRYVPVSREVVELLEGLGDENHVWVSQQIGPRNGRPVLRDGIQKVFMRTLRNAGILPPKAGPHVLRHTFGRYYVKNGGDLATLQRIMGHSNVSTTMIYVTMNDSDMEDAHASASPARAFLRREE